MVLFESTSIMLLNVFLLAVLTIFAYFEKTNVLFVFSYVLCDYTPLCKICARPDELMASYFL